MRKIKTFTSLAIISLITILFVSFFHINTYALTSDAYTIITNPGEDSSCEMNINWHTDLENTESYIIYTKKEDRNWENAKKIYPSYEISTVFDGNYSIDSNRNDIYESAQFLDYDITLKDLESDTEYMYRVGQNVLSDIHYFKTAGSSSFNFAWISDFHAYTPLPNRQSSAMNMLKVLEEQKKIDFIFDTGDSVAWGGSYSFWRTLYEEEYFKKYMWASLNGNHDNMTRNNSNNTNMYFRTVNNNPSNGYGNEDKVCYYFKYSNCLFIILNNEVLGTDVSNSRVEEAKAWVREVIETNPSQYIIVAQHYEWFNGINGAARSYGFNRWQSLFDEYNVDLAIGGNNHIYVRTKSLYNNEVSTSENLGTTYIQAPSSDNERGQEMNENLTYNEDLIACRFSEGARTVGGMIVGVNDENITVTLYDRNSNVLDEVTLSKKREEIDMSRMNKTKFISEIKYSPIDEERGYINIPNSGVGYVSNIEVLDENNEVIASSTLKKLYQTLIYVPSKSKYKVKVTYKDLLEETKTIYTAVRGECFDNVVVKIKNSKYELSWENKLDSLVKNIDIYYNDALYTTLNYSSENFTITPNNIEISDTFMICAYDNEDNIVYKKELIYNEYGDINYDGLVNNDDLLYLNSIISLSASFKEEDISIYDINKDSLVNIIDATYLKLYLDERISSINFNKYTVKIYGFNMVLLDTLTVSSNEEITLHTTGSINEYNFVGYDTTNLVITEDRIIKALYVRGEEVEEK